MSKNPRHQTQSRERRESAGSYDGDLVSTSVSDKPRDNKIHLLHVYEGRSPDDDVLSMLHV